MWWICMLLHCDELHQDLFIIRLGGGGSFVSCWFFTHIKEFCYWGFSDFLPLFICRAWLCNNLKLVFSSGCVQSIISKLFHTLYGDNSMNLYSFTHLKLWWPWPYFRIVFLPWDISVGRVSNSWSKGCGFKSWWEKREYFLLQSYKLSVLTLN